MCSTSAFDHSLSVVNSKNENISLSYSKTILTIREAGQLEVECSLDQVLWAKVTEDNTLHVSLLHRQKSGLALYSTAGGFDPAMLQNVKTWTDLLMKAAYGGCQTSRRMKIFINPHGGSGKALTIFENKVKPIFEAANCSMDVLVTEYKKHCYDHSKAMPLEYDVVVLVSGDGLVHEVFNAFADRDDAMNAFATPVVPIPTGSANGFSLCLLGLKDGHDVCAAALNAIKGRRMKLDLCSVQQQGKRSMSFMSQAIGMMADVDLGTENLRWMGESRFMLGFLREVSMNRPCPMKLEIKVAAQDKHKMVEVYRTARSQVDFAASHAEHTDVATTPSSQSMPRLEHTTEDCEGWTTIDRPLSYVFAGKLPYVSRDFMQFPIALSDDGFIDIVAQERISRIGFLKNIQGAAEGKQFWLPTQHYFKAKAYRITPRAENGHLAIDGEKYPYAPFQVEIHPRMGTTFGHGGWHPGF